MLIAQTTDRTNAQDMESGQTARIAQTMNHQQVGADLRDPRSARYASPTTTRVYGTNLLKTAADLQTPRSAEITQQNQTLKEGCRPCYTLYIPPDPAREGDTPFHGDPLKSVCDFRSICDRGREKVWQGLRGIGNAAESLGKKVQTYVSEVCTRSAKSGGYLGNPAESLRFRRSARSARGLRARFGVPENRQTASHTQRPPDRKNFTTNSERRSI